MGVLEVLKRTNMLHGESSNREKGRKLAIKRQA